MRVKYILSTICLAVLIASCEKPLTAAQKIEILENTRLEEIADMHRQQAECQAMAIEFSRTPDGEKIVKSCWDVLRVTNEATQRVLASIDKRISELNREQMKSNPLNKFDAKPGPYDDILKGETVSASPRLVPFNGKLDGEK